MCPPHYTRLVRILIVKYIFFIHFECKAEILGKVFDNQQANLRKLIIKDGPHNTYPLAMHCIAYACS